MEDRIYDAIDGIKIGHARIIFGVIVWRVSADRFCIGEEVGPEFGTVTSPDAVEALLKASRIW